MQTLLNMNHQSKDILLIEDDPNDAQLTMLALQKVGLKEKLLWLQRGEEALDYLFDHEEHRKFVMLPRVIFPDLHLPGINGHQVLSILRKNKKTRHVPVVMLSNSEEEEDITKSYLEGVNSYVIKPVQYEAFMQTIRKAGIYWYHHNVPPHLIQ